jgi:hypothetical protein
MGLSPIHYGSLSVMFGAGLLMLWLFVAGYTITALSARAILCLTGHLRARPDPWLEAALRKAFAEFDRELAVILHDRGVPQNQNYPERSRVTPDTAQGSSGLVFARGRGFPTGRALL